MEIIDEYKFGYFSRTTGCYSNSNSIMRNHVSNILEKIDREEGKKGQNYIVSVRSYLDRVIGESLNQALYDLEVQRERSPDKKELFTAIGSIKFISQYLLDHKQ